IALPDEPIRKPLLMRNGFIFEWAHPLQTRQRYFLRVGDVRPTETEDLYPYLEVAEPSPELAEFLTPFKAMREDEAVRALMHVFQDGGFQYSLEPPRVETMEDFLFRTKIGFCEHFAATLATLL